MNKQSTNIYLTKNKPSLIAIAKLFLHNITKSITINKARKLSDILKTVEGPIH